MLKQKCTFKGQIWGLSIYQALQSENWVFADFFFIHYYGVPRLC